MHASCIARINGNVSNIYPVYLVPECGSVTPCPSVYPVIPAVLRDTIKDTPCFVFYRMIIAQIETWIFALHLIN
jgi:hypothetical protein